MKPSTGMTGAAHELLVSTDLIKRGYHVFRALSPSAPCDLIAYRNGPPLRIEVRTVYLSKSGEIKYKSPDKDLGKHDVLALVTHSGIIEYRPDLFSLSHSDT